MSDYNVGVEVDVDYGELDALESRINKLKSKTLNINVNTNDAERKIANLMNGKTAGTKRLNVIADTSGARKEIVSLNGTIGRGMKPIRIDADFSRIEKQVGDIEKRMANIRDLSPGKSSKTRDDYGKMYSDLKKISELSSDVSKLDISKNARDIEVVTNRIEKFKSSYEDALDKIGGKLKPKQINALNNLIDETNFNLDRIKAKMQDSSDVSQAKAQAKEISESFKELLRIQKQIGDTKISLINAGSDADVEKYTRRLKELEAQAKRTEASLGELTDKQIRDFNNVTDKQKQRVTDVQDKRTQKAQAAYLKRLESEADKAKSILNKHSNIDADYGKIRDDFDRIKSQSRDAAASVDKLRSSYEGLQRAATIYNNNKSETNARNLIAAEEKYQSALKDTNGYLKQTMAVEKQRAAAQKEAVSISRLNNSKKDFSLQIDRWLDNNTAAVASFGDRIRHLQTQIESCDNIQLGNLKTQFKEITTEAQLAGKTGLRSRDSLAKKAKEYASYFATASLAFEGAYVIQEMARNVLEVDTAMTGLYRVTDLTSEQYSKLYDGLTVSAKEYGVTLVDLINSTADWSRAGFDANTAKGLAEVTTMYQHIADLDYKTASQNLLTAYKGFEGELTSPKMFGKDTVGAVSYIGDILNELDNNYSVTAAGIGEALKRSASALDVAGNSIQETAG